MVGALSHSGKTEMDSSVRTHSFTAYYRQEVNDNTIIQFVILEIVYTTSHNVDIKRSAKFHV